MKFGYARVSTAEQHLDRQLAALTEAGVEDDNIFREKVSGAKAHREQLERLKTYLREGDIVVVTSYDRLARSTKQLLEIQSELEEKGVALVSLKEKVDTSTPQGKFFFTVVAAVAEFERALNHERQAEGIALARKRGARIGRTRIPQERLDKAVALYKKGDLCVRDICKVAEISRTPLYRELNRLGLSRQTPNVPTPRDDEGKAES